MHYTALYRKYRPRLFADLVGQQHVAVTLKNALLHDRVVHAYLFCGPRGTGKTSAAHILARAVNCLQPQQGEPCGQCEACRRILAGQSLDIIEIDAASNRGIDKMRDLRDGVKYTPAQERYKVYIIDEVHMLTNEAFNALLKTLEEPPAHTIFILATTEPHQVLPTVLSRCQRFDFHRIGQQDVVARLEYIAQQEDLAVTPKAYQLIAKRSGGGLRDAVGLLDQCLTTTEGEVTSDTVSYVLGSIPQEMAASLAMAVAQKDTVTMLSLVDQLVAEGKDLRQILLQLLEYLRDELLESLRPDGQAAIPRRRLLQMLRDLVDADLKMKESQSARITLELALLGAARLDEAPEGREDFPPQAAKTPSMAQAGTTGGARKGAVAEERETFPPPADKTPPAAPARLTAGTREEAKKKEVFPPPGVDSQAQAPPAMAASKAQDRAAETASSEETAQSAPASLFASIQQHWSDILQRVRREKVTTYAFLREATPLRLEGAALVLGFHSRYALHMQTLMEEEHRKRTEQILTGLYQTPLQLRAELLPEEETPADWFGGGTEG